MQSYEAALTHNIVGRIVRQSEHNSGTFLAKTTVLYGLIFILFEISFCPKGGLPDIEELLFVPLPVGCAQLPGTFRQLRLGGRRSLLWPWLNRPADNT